MNIKLLRQHQPYKSLWDRGKGFPKELAEKDIQYVWYVISKDKENPYRNLPLEERRTIAAKDVYENSRVYNPPDEDKVIAEAIEKGLYFNKTVTDRLLEGSLHAAEQLAKWLMDVTYDRRTRETFDPDPINTQLTKIGNIILQIKKLQEQSDKEASENKILGQLELNEYEE